MLGIMLMLMAAGFWPSLARLWAKTFPLSSTVDINWQHAMLVPLFGLYYLYVNREDLAKKTIRPLVPIRFSKNQLLTGAIVLAVGGALVGLTKVANSSSTVVLALYYIGLGMGIMGTLAIAMDWGLGTTLSGILIYAAAIHPIQNDYLKDIGLLITLFGVVLTLFGWDVMRIAWFPILFLLCAIPWSGLMYSWLASPLQVLAARVAAAVLRLSGVSATVSGTNISMMGSNAQMSNLNVEEACAGLKSLMTFLAIGAGMAFLSARPLWQRLTITFSAIPIAIACNTMRISVQGLLDYHVSRELSQNFAHAFVGMVLLIPAFFLLLGVGWLLDQIFIEEVDDTQVGRPGGAKIATVAAGFVSAPPAVRSVTRSSAPAATKSVAPAATAAPKAPVAQAAPVATRPTPVNPAAAKPVAPVAPKATTATQSPTAPAAKANPAPAAHAGRVNSAPAAPAVPPRPNVVPAAPKAVTPPAPGAGAAIPVPPSRRAQVAQNRKPPTPPPAPPKSGS